MADTAGTSKQRRSFIKKSAGLSLGMLAFPGLSRAQSTKEVRVGIIHPMTGLVAYSGQHCRLGSMLAIEQINGGGGIKSLGGARITPVLGDSQGRVEVGVSEVERMNEQGVVAYLGCYNSPVGIAATQAASKYNTPFVVDVGASDLIVSRGLPNVFRFSPGYGVCVDSGVAALGAINKAAGNPASTVVLVHESGEMGVGTVKLLQEKLPGIGFKVLDVIAHDNPARSFDNVALRLRSMKPDLVMHTAYPNEYMLLARTLKRFKVPVTQYSIIGAGFGVKFLRESPDAASYQMDFNHWYRPHDARAIALKEKVEASNHDFIYEVFCSYNAVMLLADALERAGSTDKEALRASLAASTWSGHFMPYGPTKFVNGQNVGGRAVGLQILDGKIEVIYPDEFASAKAVFPNPAAA